MIGQVIGQTYRIEGKIGEGGMGAVYRGRDLLLDREVAVKALRPELARQPELVARFRSEAQVLARLNHSHIATLFSFVREGEDYFMVMEFVPGRTLEAILQQQGALDAVTAARIFCQVLDGVGHAHGHGVVHRDLKPANVMLDGMGEVKVMDFGIARVLGSARQTKTGRLIGTLEYMSPEQMHGRESDARSDIYALGIVLYEMLTGSVPFRSDSDFELMRAQIEAAPPPPRELRADIPPALESAILRALAKAPEARYQTVQEFRAALVNAVPEIAGSAPLRPLEPLLKGTRQAADDEWTARRNSAPGHQVPAVVAAATSNRFKHLYAAAAALLFVVAFGSVAYIALRPQPAPAPVAPTPQPVAVQPTPLPSALPSALPIDHSVGLTPLPQAPPEALPQPLPPRTDPIPTMMPTGQRREAVVRQPRTIRTPQPAPPTFVAPTPTPKPFAPTITATAPNANAARPTGQTAKLVEDDKKTAEKEEKKKQKKEKTDKAGKWVGFGLEVLKGIKN